MRDLKQKAVRGGFAKICGQAVNLFLRVVLIAALARFLTPEDFGLVGMVTALTGVINILTNAWLSSGSVQQSAISEEQLSTLFWLYVGFGVLMFLSCLAVAPVLVAFYQEPRLLGVTATLATGCLFTTAGVQHFAILQRQMRYVALAVIETSSFFASAAVGVIMAIAGFGYWALVAATIVLPACNTAGLWLATRWMPGAPRRAAGVWSTMSFGSLITLNILVVYLAYNLDKVLIGRFWGADALGIYGRAYQLGTIPPDNINAAVGGVAFSAMSRLRDDPARLRNYFLKGYGLVLALSFPIAVLCALYAEEAVLVVLGARWIEAAGLLRLLTPTILVFSIINPLGWLLFSIGMVWRSTVVGCAIAIVVSVGFVIGLPHGPKGVAFAFSAATTLWLIPHVVWSLHGTPISQSDLIGAVGRPLVSTAIAALFAHAAHHYFAELSSPFIRLTIGGAVMFAVYFIVLMLVFRQKSFYLGLVKDLLKRPASVDADG